MFSRHARPAVFGVVAALAALGAPPCVLAEPLTLAGAVARAQDRSPELIAAQAGLAAAEGRALQAGLRPNPEAGLTAENIAGSGPYGDFASAETTLQVSQRLELGGKRRARADAALAEVAAARIGFAVARADLTQEVAIRYAEALASRDRLALARERAGQTRSLASMAKTLVDSGRDPPLRALRAAAVSSEADAAIVAAETEAAAAARALASLWGQTDQGLELAAPEPAAAARPEPADLTTTLDVRLAQAQRQIAEAVIERERAAGRPDLTVQAGVRRFEQTGDSALVVGFVAPLQVFDRNQGALAAARAEAVAAEAKERLALVRAMRAVRDAQAALRAADARLAVLESAALPQAKTAEDLARRGFEAGKFSLLDVLDAQTALTDARTDLIAARLTRAKALAALDRAAAH